MTVPPRSPIADKNAADNDQAPEAHNRSQDDAGEQAQTLADEALGRGSDFGEGESETLEGPEALGSVVIEFPTMDEARAWYRSDAYQQARADRFAGADYRVFLTQGM